MKNESCERKTGTDLQPRNVDEKPRRAGGGVHGFE
jgi:hypothetical protein